MKERTMKRLVLAALLASSAAFAQIESPLLSKVQVNVVNPGGKSLAMGGAFVSLADDPTAALANPAGLAQLGSWELGVSGKGFKFEPRLDTANFFQDSATSDATLEAITTSEPSRTSSDLEFVSLVVPIVKDVTFSAYRAVNLRYQLDGDDLPGGNYRVFFVNRAGSQSISLDEQGGLDLRSTVYGASVGAKFGPLALGAGLTFNKLRYDLTGGAAGGEHLFISNADNRGIVGTANPYFETRVSSDVRSGTKTGWIVGARAVLDEAHALAAGGVYRHSPTFDVGYSIHATSETGAPIANFSCGVDDPSIPGSGASACGTFRVPDDWSLGISGRVLPRLLIAADVQRIRYSQLNDGYVPIFAYRYGANNASRAISLGHSDDGTLYRLGAEWTLVAKAGSEVSLRAGWYHEPAHGTKVQLFADDDRNRIPDTSTPVNAPPISQAYATTFDGGDSENHYSFGLGAALARRFSIDLAFDISKTTKSAVLSAFARF
jgi:long-chain fatty acid transport protein